MPLSLPLLNLQLGACSSTLLVTYLINRVLILVFIKLTIQNQHLLKQLTPKKVILPLAVFTNIQIWMLLILKITILTKFQRFYHKQDKEHKQVFLLGDFDINLLNYNDHQPTNDFLDSLASNSFIPYILHPTRITSHSKTLIDKIFSNYISREITSGNITSTISDHLPQFSFVPNILSSPSTQKSNFYERDRSKCKQKKLYT